MIKSMKKIIYPSLIHKKKSQPHWFAVGIFLSVSYPKLSTGTMPLATPERVSFHYSCGNMMTLTLFLPIRFVLTN